MSDQDKTPSDDRHIPSSAPSSPAQALIRTEPVSPYIPVVRRQFPRPAGLHALAYNKTSDCESDKTIVQMMPIANRQEILPAGSPQKLRKFTAADKRSIAEMTRKLCAAFAGAALEIDEDDIFEDHSI